MICTLQLLVTEKPDDIRVILPTD